MSDTSKKKRSHSEEKSPKKVKVEVPETSIPSTSNVKLNSHKLHFEYELSEDVAQRYYDLFEEEEQKSWPELGTFYATCQDNKSISRAIPLVPKTSLEELSLKENLKKMCQTYKFRNKLGEMSPLQYEFFGILSDYNDLIFSNLMSENSRALRTMYSLHIMNHILQTSARIIHHNSKIAANPNEEYKDQGFTRPTCLVLVPFREDCYRIVKIFESFLENVNVMNKSRFEKEYGSEKPHPRANPKPEDFEETFAGNINEDFKIGMKIKNKSICLFTEFYSSDLIIASPLGLRQLIGAPGDKERDYDFMSSIEILIIDRAEIILMQNWYHLVHVLKHVNLLPTQSRGCNFSRVRTYALDEQAKFYRQTVLLSSIEHAWFKALFNHGQCYNHAGYLRTWRDVETPSVSQVVIPLPQVFRRFDTELLKNDLDDRFNFFISQVLPHFKNPAMAQTLIYVPSYFDFVRLRNYFRSEEISCAMVCEYSKSGKIAQARDLFFHGHRHFMLYTERAHFYNRFKVKGIQHVLFYQLPTFPHFYQEVCNLILHSNPKKKQELLAENSCMIIVSKFDCIQLKHAVGMNKAKHILGSKKNVFMIKTA